MVSLLLFLPHPEEKHNNGTYWNNGTFQLLSNAKKFQEELEERLTFCIMDIMGTLANLEGKLGIGCCWQEGSGNTGGWVKDWREEDGRSLTTSWLPMWRDKGARKLDGRHHSSSCPDGECCSVLGWVPGL